MEDPKSPDELNTQKKKGTSNSLFVFLCCLIYAIFAIGWRGFFVGIGITPIGTLANLLGIAVVPFLLGWVIAKVASFAARTVSFRSLWLTGSTLVFVLMLVGQYRASTGS